MPIFESNDFNNASLNNSDNVSVYTGLTSGTPTSWPVTLEEIKEYANIQESSSDELLLALREAATTYAEDYTNRAISTKTYTLRLPSFPLEAIELPMPIVQSLTSIQYIDSNGATQTLSASNYSLMATSINSLVYPKYGYSWPDTRSDRQAVTITYVAGYATCPEILKTAIKMLVNHWYENRQPSVTGTITSDIKLTVDSILNMYRVVSI